MSSGEKASGRGSPRSLPGGPTRFGPFILESRLAVGGTAEVYIAHPVDPQARPRRLVVKRMLPQFLGDPEGRTMFEREAALHAAVQHDNVVRVYGSGTVDNEPWLAMELVEGCDLFRLLRRLAGEGRTVGVGLATYIARQMLGALESVHRARDATGAPMGIVHRDVTPSNIYLSSDGAVKLGDFGIARSLSRPTFRSAASAILKGKFAYLAPEQVAGEPFDQRADLFVAAAVIAEIALGRPLFAGSGQLAVLLAIRDCRIEPLREARASLPRGFFEVIERALAREPESRYATAEAFSKALAPFEGNAAAARTELGVLVRAVQSAPSVEQMQAVRDSAQKLRAAEAVQAAPHGESEPARISRDAANHSVVIRATGLRLGPWAFARLVEAIATGEIGRGDSVEYMGRGPQPIETVEDLARFLPAKTTGITDRIGDFGAPEFAEDVSPAALVRILVHVLESESTGVLFVERPTDAGQTSRQQSAVGRKDLYFVGGKLHHIASNNASELLGEFLVRRGMISREELDLSLAVLPRYRGRMGDTLIALGLIGSIDIFRAIRDQGRDRFIDLFRWRTGTLTYYAGPSSPQLDFPLELDLAPLIVAGIGAAMPGQPPFDAWRDRLDHTLRVSTMASPRVRKAVWPPIAKRVLDLVRTPRTLRSLLAAMTQDGTTTANDALPAIEVLIAAKVMTISA
ncbi:MAG: serine/threonine-protein kinase [Polyangiaceae bacterium]|jgi:serine/threonine-protein kinase